MRTLDDFITYLYSIKGYSQNTVKAYRKDLEAFASWATQNVASARWSNISRNNIDAFIIHQQQRGLSPATTNRQLAAISSLYNYFKREGLKVENPCKYESRRKMVEKVPNTIPLADLRAAYQNAKGVARFMLGLLSTTGIRIQEMLNLHWDDIDFESGRISIYGKGGKERIVYTEDDVLEEAKGAWRLTAPKGKMFHIGQREARFIIYKALSPYSNARQLSPHAIRHSVATYMAMSGQNVVSIAKLLGHSHIETTQKYINMAEAEAIRTGVQLN